MQHQDAALRRNPPGSKTLNRQLNKLGPQPRGDRDADPGVTQRLATGLSAKGTGEETGGPLAAPPRRLLAEEFDAHSTPDR